METLKYKAITSEKQYDKYCQTLEELVFSSSKIKEIKEEISLLTLLIEKWDEDHNNFNEVDPIRLLQSFMKEHVSKGYVSEILNYKKGLSKEVIRKLADYFKVKQDAFNRPYQLIFSQKTQSFSEV